MSIRETTIWRKLFPIPTDEFLRNVINRVNLEGLEKVVITIEDGEPGDGHYTIEYEAMKGHTVMMRARDHVDEAEYRAALHEHDGDVHADLDAVIRNWTEQKVKDVEQKLLEAKVSVEIVYR